MKNLANRMVAVAGLVAFLGLYGCNEDGKSGGSQSDSSGTAAAPASGPSYAAVSPEVSSAMRTSDSAAQASNAAADPVAPAEQAKQASNQTFDGSGDHSALASSSDDNAVHVPPSSGQNNVAYTAAPPKKQLDDPADAPPAPEANAGACKDVLDSQGQASDGCGAHARLSLVVGGVKAGLKAQFGTAVGWGANIAVSILALLAMEMATGGWAVVVKLLLTLCKWGSIVYLLAQATAFVQAFLEWKNAKEGSQEWAEGIWGMSRAGTIIAVLAGLFSTERFAKLKLKAPAAGTQMKLPFSALDANALPKGT